MSTTLLAWHIKYHYCYKCQGLIFLKSLDNKSASSKLAKYGGPGHFCCLHLNYLNREVGARNEGSQGVERGEGFCHCKLTYVPHKGMARLSYVRNPATVSRLVTVNASFVRNPSLCSKGTDLVPKPAPPSSRSTSLVFQVFVLSSLSSRFKELGHSQMC